MNIHNLYIVMLNCFIYVLLKEIMHSNYAVSSTREKKSQKKHSLKLIICIKKKVENCSGKMTLFFWQNKIHIHIL